MKKRIFRLAILICLCFNVFENTIASFSSVVSVTSNIIQVKAWDSSPVTTVTVNSVRMPAEKIINGDFGQGLMGWDAIGDVALVSEKEHDVIPIHQNMIRIGRDIEDGSKNVNENILSQQIKNDGSGIAAVGFWYNFQTFETAPGFDEPGFMV